MFLLPLVKSTLASEISIGCVTYWEDSHVGIVTDFQLFSRILSKQEMERWTGCQERLQGDIVSWDTEEWSFNQTGNGSTIEYLDFENNVCN